jgi:hypothetical protein
VDLKIQCGYCGTYTPTDAELKDIYHQSMFTDYTCLRCNDEVYVLRFCFWYCKLSNMVQKYPGVYEVLPEDYITYRKLLEITTARQRAERRDRSEAARIAHAAKRSRSTR